MDRITALQEQRKTALAAYDAFIDPLVESGEILTPEQEARKAELKGAVDQIDRRLDELEAEEKRSAAISEVRSTLKQTVEVVSEPTTYGPDSPNSYFADLARSFSPSFRGHYQAIERLQAASHEAAVEMVNATPEKRRRIEAMIREENRDNGNGGADRALKDYRELGRTGRMESRAGMDTTSGSGGSFATPVYFIGEYAPYREAGRAFVDQCNKQDLPAYGMTVYLPHVTGPAGVASQSSQNTAIQETDPTAGYLSANLATEAGQVTVSQQLLDRAGPGFEFDKMVFDQLQRDYAPKVDTYVLTQALANAGTVAYTDTTGFHLNTANATGGFYSKVAGAKAAIRKAAGVVMTPTHLFLTPDRWEFIEGWADGQARPVVVPGYAGPFNAVAAGNQSGSSEAEGDTGFKLASLPVFADLNIPTPTVGNDQAIVGNLNEVYVYEGTPVTRVLPQTQGQNLSVLLQLYSYLAVIPRYPAAIQSIQGSGMASISF